MSVTQIQFGLDSYPRQGDASPMPTVLSIHGEGNHTRDLILAEAGFSVLPATTLHQAVELFRSTTIDAVVIEGGHSASTVTPFASVLKTVKPGIPVLLVTDSGNEAGSAECVDTVMARLDGPLALLDHLRKLIINAETNARASVQAGNTAVTTATELRTRMGELRDRLRKVRELSQQIRKRKKPA